MSMTDQEDDYIPTPKEVLPDDLLATNVKDIIVKVFKRMREKQSLWVTLTYARVGTSVRETVIEKLADRGWDASFEDVPGAEIGFFQ